jgi:cyclopropane-fatty-acyl-phospholipid synthase
MSFRSVSTDTLQALPSRYSEVRLHHALGLYIGCQILVASGIYRWMSNQILAVASKLTESLIPVIQQGFVPDFLIRYGIRLQLSNHLQQLRHPKVPISAKETSDVPVVELILQKKMDIIQALSTMPIAIDTDKANEQHYEVPASFYNYCLGPYKKYSSGYWSNAQSTFAESEVAMLQLYCVRAGIAAFDPTKSYSVVDLGCGWGSLTLYIASHYPHVKITGISNSHSQRLYITQQANERNLTNITILTVRTQQKKRFSLVGVFGPLYFLSC